LLGTNKCHEEHAENEVITGQNESYVPTFEAKLYESLITYRLCLYVGGPHNSNYVGPHAEATFKVVTITKEEIAAKEAKEKIEAEAAEAKKKQEETKAIEKRVAEETATAAKKHQEEISTTKAKPLTRAQLLAKALKQCKKLKPKSKRVKCEKQAHKKYGPKLTKKR
jgi:succinate dehydrogenase/fumarate reductase flavoprotein subunit